MSFDESFLIQTLNKFAPEGFKFVYSGKHRKFALIAKESSVDAKGAFISDISVQMINDLFGRLLSSRKMKEVRPCAEYTGYCFMLAKSRLSKSEYETYKSILSGIEKPFMSVLIKENAALVDMLHFQKKKVPDYLNRRLHNYVNYSVWNAFQQLFSRISVGDLRNKNMMFAKSDCYYNPEHRNLTVSSRYNKFLSAISGMSSQIGVDASQLQQVVALLKTRVKLARLR